MDYEKFGICVTIVILVVLLGAVGTFSSISSDTPKISEYNPNGAQTSSIAQNDALENYCEVFKINC